LHPRVLRQGVEYHDHIEPHARLGVFPVRTQEQLSCARDASAFAPVDARSGAAIPLTAACADLDDHEGVAVACNEVYFAEPSAKIAQEYLEPLILQETSRGRLGCTT